MTIINQQQINEVLSIYKPEQRILLSADLQYPIIYGNFKIGPTYYIVNPLKHATDIEIQLCLNQLVYVGVAEIRGLGLVLNLNGLNFKELQDENMFILKSNKKFRKHIRTDIEIRGELEFKNQKKYKNIIFTEAHFNFENKSCIGGLELALIKPNAFKK